MLLAGCGGESGPTVDRDLERETRERAAALEAAEKNILGADVPVQEETKVAAAPAESNILANEAESPRQSDNASPP